MLTLGWTTIRTVNLRGLDFITDRVLSRSLIVVRVIPRNGAGIPAAVLPPVSRLTEFSRTVAEKVAACAVEEGLAEQTDIGKAIDAIRWTPEYRPLNI